MTIGISYIAIKQKGKLSVCSVNWLWAMPIFQAETPKNKKIIRGKLKKIFKGWNKDDKINPKQLAKNKEYDERIEIIKSNLKRLMEIIENNRGII